MCERPEFYTESKRKAWKEHRCSLCSGNINKGEKYVNISAKSEGCIFTYKHHVNCSRLLEFFHKPDDHDYNCDFVLLDDFSEALNEYIEDTLDYSEKVEMLYDYLNKTNRLEVDIK